MEIIEGKPRQTQSQIIFSFWVVLLITPNCILADVKVIPTLESSISYTDNVALSNDADAVTSNIIQLTPGISLLATGRNIDAALEYQFQNIYYPNVVASDDDYYQNYNKLNGNLASELYKNLFYFDGSASVYQVSAPGQGQSSLDNLSLSGQRGTVRQFTLSPYLSTRIGEYANTEIRYEYTSLNGDETVVNESYISEFTLSLDSGERFNRIIWGLNAANRDVVYEQQDDLRFYFIQLDADYEVSSGVNFLVEVGHENDEYLTLGNVSTEDNYWSLGVRLQPGERTNILIKAGRHYYGNTGLLDINHRAKNSTWNLSYLEDITTQSSVDVESQVVPVGDDGQQSADLGQIFGILSLPSLTTEAIFRKKASAGLDMNYQKLLGRVNLSQTKYDYLLSGDSEDVYAAEVGLAWSFTPRSEITITDYWQRRDFISSTESERLQQWIIAMNYLASRLSTLKLEYRNSDLETDSGIGEYTQNIYSLGLNMRF